MADANRMTLSLRGIGSIKNKHGELRDDEVAYEKLPEYDRYTGTATALISAGIVEEHMLPGQPDRAIASVTVAGPEGFIVIARESDRLFTVQVSISAEEIASRAEREKRLKTDKAAQELQAALAREAKELSALPRSRERYRDDCVRTLKAHLRIVRDTAIVANKHSGFHFDSRTVRAFDDAAMQLLKTVLHGEIVFDAAVQERRIVEIRSPGSKANLPLQNFLQDITSRNDNKQQPAAEDEGA
jgi:hypothetical protein